MPNAVGRAVLHAAGVAFRDGDEPAENVKADCEKARWRTRNAETRPAATGLLGMAGSRDDTSSQALLDQQRVLAEFGEVALNAEDLSAILNEACRLVGEALRTDLAKVVELLPDGKTMLVRAGVGWRPGVVNQMVISTHEGSPEGLTLKEGAVISPDINREDRFSYHEFLRDHGVQAFVNVMILSGKGRPPFGVLQVDSRLPREFKQSDIEFLRTYANLLGGSRRCSQLRSRRFAMRQPQKRPGPASRTASARWLSLTTCSRGRTGKPPIFRRSLPKQLSPTAVEANTVFTSAGLPLACRRAWHWPSLWPFRNL